MSDENEVCLHCSSPTRGGEEFCCRGCESVYGFLHDSGLEKFYDLKSDAVLVPLQDRPFQEHNWEWVDHLPLQKEGAMASIELGINGLSCVACIWLVEAIAKDCAGIETVNLSIARGSIEVFYDPENADFKELAASLYKLGYELFPSVRKQGKVSGLGMQLGVCGSLAMNTMAFTLPRYTGMKVSDDLYDLFTIVVVASSTLTFLVGGSYFFKRAWKSLKMGAIHMDLPIAIGLIMAYLGSLAGWVIGNEELFYFDFVAIFTFLMLLGKQVQSMSLNRVNTKFHAQKAVPDHYMKESGEQAAVSELKLGDIIKVPAGSVVPAPCELWSESAECSLAWITGEPLSVSYGKHDLIQPGVVNQSRDAIAVRLKEDADAGHYLFQMPRRSEQMAPQLATFVRYYLLSVLVIGILAGIVWYVATWEAVKSLQVLLSIYVVSCPCGIGLALPLLDTRFDQYANYIGAFPLTARVWGSLLKLKRVVFDKTGTLTLDRPHLVDEGMLAQLSEEEREMLFTLTQGSLHPVSRALFSAVIRFGTTQSRFSGIEVQEITGVGMRAEMQGEGQEKGQGKVYELKRSQGASSQLATSFVIDGEERMMFAFQESTREHSRESIAALDRFLPKHAVILSGDQVQSVEAVACQLGIQEALGGLKPEEKKQKLLAMQEDGGVLFIGDGMNDLPALREAGLSAAPFGQVNLVGGEVDLLFTDETMSFLPKLFCLAKSRQKLARQVVTYTILYNVAVVSISAAGMMSPLFAAIIMPISSLISLFIVIREVPQLR